MTKRMPNLRDSLFSDDGQTYEEVGVRMNMSLEAIRPQDAGLEEMVETGGERVRAMRSLEIDLLPATTVAAINAQNGRRRKAEIAKEWKKTCELNCTGCFQMGGVYSGADDLVPAQQLLDIVEQATEELGTKTVKFLGPRELLRDPDLFKYLDRFQEMDVTFGLFTKDPMLGDDSMVEKVFGSQGIRTAEQLVERLADYSNVRILYNFRSLDDEVQNSAVRMPAQPSGDYKERQNRSLELLHERFVKDELDAGRESRLVIINSPIDTKTVDEAYEIFTYFMDRGVPVISTSSMESGAGGRLCEREDDEFREKLVDFYARANAYTMRRGLISREEWEEQGPAAYAGMAACLSVSSNLFLRATGRVDRCPGWEGDKGLEATASELAEKGIVGVWRSSENYAAGPVENMGCPAKGHLFTDAFFADVKARTLEYIGERR